MSLSCKTRERQSRNLDEERTYDIWRGCLKTCHLGLCRRTSLELALTIVVAMLSVVTTDIKSRRSDGALTFGRADEVRSLLLAGIVTIILLAHLGAGASHLPGQEQKREEESSSSEPTAMVGHAELKGPECRRG